MSITSEYRYADTPELYDLHWIDMEIDLERTNLDSKYKKVILGEYRALKNLGLADVERCRNEGLFDACVEKIRSVSDKLGSIVQKGKVAQSTFEREQAELQAKVAGTGRKVRAKVDWAAEDVATEAVYRLGSRACLLTAQQEHAVYIPHSRRQSIIKAVATQLEDRVVKSERIDTSVKIAVRNVLGKGKASEEHVEAFSEEFAQSVRGCSEKEVRSVEYLPSNSFCAKRIEACMSDRIERESKPSLYLQEKGTLAPLAARLAEFDDPSFFKDFFERGELVSHAIDRMDIPPESRTTAHIQAARAVRHCYDVCTVEDRQDDRVMVSEGVPSMPHNMEGGMPYDDF